MTVKYIEDITRWREDMNFISEWQNNKTHLNTVKLIYTLTLLINTKAYSHPNTLYIQQNDSFPFTFAFRLLRICSPDTTSKIRQWTNIMSKTFKSSPLRKQLLPTAKYLSYWPFADRKHKDPTHVFTATGQTRESSAKYIKARAVTFNDSCLIYYQYAVNLLRFTGVAAGAICQHNLTHKERSVFNEKKHIILRKMQRTLHLTNYYIDTSVLLEKPLVKFIKTTSGTRVVYFP